MLTQNAMFLVNADQHANNTLLEEIHCSPSRSSKVERVTSSPMLLANFFTVKVVYHVAATTTKCPVTAVTMAARSTRRIQ